MSNLIDRDALLNAMEEERQHLLARGQTGAEHIIVHHCLPLIDNAPTVEVDEMTQDLINKVNVNIGLAKPIKDERPQGEYTEEDIKYVIKENFGLGYEMAKNKYARQQGEWIPISERLPEYSGLYLISVDDLVTVANFTGTYFMNRVGGRIEVHAWQSLPEPYKKGSSGKDSI